MASEYALFHVGILFAAAAAVGMLARAFDQSVIPAYILVGMGMNEYVLGAVSPWGIDEGAMTFVEIGAELGIVFLLFFLGLEFNLDRLLASKARIGKAGTIDLTINFGAGLVLGYLLFGALLPAFLVAGIVYISSSAIITKSLIDLGWIANDEADPLLGTLVYEDLVIAIYLAIATALVAGGDGLADAAESIGIALGFLLLLLAFVSGGTSVLEALLSTDSNEFVVLRTVGVTVLIAGAALAVGVSEAVAAFFVGMAFSSTDHVHRIERLLEPLRDAFAAVFFLWIGLETDPWLFGGVVALVAAAVVVTTPTKLVSGYLGGRVYDLDARRSTRVGLGITTRGEFSLIIATLALSADGGALSGDVAGTIYAFTVGYVLVMSVLGTSLMQYSSAIESVVVPRLEEREAEAESAKR